MRWLQEELWAAPLCRGLRWEWVQGIQSGEKKAEQGSEVEEGRKGSWRAKQEPDRAEHEDHHEELGRAWILVKEQ